MSAVVIDGKQVAADVRAEVAKKVADLKTKGITPCLAVILVGENPASVSYVTGKQKALAAGGMSGRSVKLPTLTGWKPSTSFEGSIAIITLSSLICLGSGSWTKIP